MSTAFLENAGSRQCTKEHRRLWAPIYYAKHWADELKIPEEKWSTALSGHPYSCKLCAPDGTLQTYHILCDCPHEPYTIVGLWDEDGFLVDVQCLRNGVPMTEEAVVRQREAEQRILQLLEEQHALWVQRLKYTGIAAGLAVILLLVAAAGYHTLVGGKSRQSTNAPKKNQNPANAAPRDFFTLDPTITMQNIEEHRIKIDWERRVFLVGTEYSCRLDDLTQPIQIRRKGNVIEISVQSKQETAIMEVRKGGYVPSSKITPRQK